MDSAALDDVINRLLDVKGRPGKQVQLSEAEIRQLCSQSRQIFLHQPNLLELEAPIKICGKFLGFLLTFFLLYSTGVLAITILLVLLLFFVISFSFWVLLLY